MSITSLGGGSANSLLLQQMLASLSANAVDQTDGPDAAGSADSTGQPATIPLGPAPPPADGQPSDLFSSDTLGALTATQAAGSGGTAGPSLLDGASPDLASQVMGVADTSGGGGFSLSDLTSGLEQAIGSSAAPPPPSPTASADAPSGDSFTTDAAPITGSDPTGTTTTAATTASTTDPTAATGPTSNQQAANMLASLMLQYANASYSTQAQAAAATTTAATSITA